MALKENHSKPRLLLLRDARGATALIAAFFIVGGIGLLGLVIDLGHIYVVKSELQRAADAGAMAGAASLVATAPGTQSPVPITPNCTQALATTQTIVAANRVDGSNPQLLTEDVTFGTFDVTTGVFTATGCTQPRQVTAIKVLVRKDDTANGPVPLYFLGVLPGAWRTKSLTAKSVGLTGYAGYAPRGAGTFPLAIDSDRISQTQDGQLITIHLNPTPGDGGAWHSFDDQSPGTSDLRDLVNGSTPSPPLMVGDSIRVKEGVSDSVLSELERVWSNKGGSMDILVPVISPVAHTGWVSVLGFAAFRISFVDSHGSDKLIQGYTKPYFVAPGVAPGGSNYGMWAGVPKMVQ